MSISNPYNVLPSGQLLLSGSNSQSNGFGRLAQLSHELLQHIFGFLAVKDLLRIETTSKAFLVLCRQEHLFKEALLERSGGYLNEWKGSWRDSYRSIFLKLQPSRIHPTSSLFSDILYQPYLVAAFEPDSITSAKSFQETIPRIDARTLSSSSQLSKTPCILTHAMDDWPALTSRPWTMKTLPAICPPETRYRAEAVLSSMQTYLDYCQNCPTEDAPCYLFESHFVEKSAKDGSNLGNGFKVPKVFDEDLFKLFGEERPDYRWLIIGPKRSGSTFHKDPNNTSAWNAVVEGAKLWITFPPDVIPPGVFVSDDQSQVETPVSLAEWLMSYHPRARARHGPQAKDPKLRNTMMQGICRAGECFYVPSGYWHLVINVEDSIAVTQNYVSKRELANVLSFMKHRPEQLSGFKQCEVDEDVPSNEVDTRLFSRFCDLLKQHDNNLLMDALKSVAAMEVEQSQSQSKVVSSLWKGLKKEEETTEDKDSGFSFGFDLQ